MYNLIKEVFELNYNPSEVGNKIRNMRKSLGLNQAEFAKRIGATVPAVSNWENGRNLPNNERLTQIAKVADTSVNELLYGSKQAYITNVIQEYCKKNEAQVNETALNKTIQQYPDKTTYEPAEGIIDFYTMFDNGLVEFAPMNKILEIYKTVIEDLEEKKANNDNFTKEDEQVLQYFKDYVSKNE